MDEVLRKKMDLLNLDVNTVGWQLSCLEVKRSRAGSWMRIV